MSTANGKSRSLRTAAVYVPLEVSVRQIVTGRTVMNCATFCRLIALTVGIVDFELIQVPRSAGPPPIAPTYAAVDGDPVDLSTGLYIRRTVDLVLMDTIPVVFARTYRNRDTLSRPFGIGTNHSYGSFLIGDPRPSRISN